MCDKPKSVLEIMTDKPLIFGADSCTLTGEGLPAEKKETKQTAEPDNIPGTPNYNWKK